MKRIDSIAWRIKIDGVEYGDYVNLTDEFGETKEDRDLIAKVLGEIFDLLKQQAIYTTQKIITGKESIDDIIDEVNNSYKLKGK